MVNISLEKYSELQKRYLLKGLVSGFTGTLLIAVLTMEIVSNFSTDIILLKNYLMNVPMILILVPCIKHLIKKHPINCYRLKGILSIAGLVMLVFVEIFGLSKNWYLVDAAIVSLGGLLMMTHNSYYKACVNNKCKDFSEMCGYVELFTNLTYVFVGVAIVAMDIPTLVILSLALPLECIERYLENKCAYEVYTTS